MDRTVEIKRRVGMRKFVSVVAMRSLFSAREQHSDSSRCGCEGRWCCREGTSSTRLRRLAHAAAKMAHELPGKHFSPPRSFMRHGCGWSTQMATPQTGQQLIEPLRHNDWVMSAEFSPDGRRIVTASMTTASLDIAPFGTLSRVAAQDGRNHFRRNAE
jgi:hypothetical protein